MATIDHEQRQRLVQDHPLLQAPPEVPADLAALAEAQGWPEALLQRAARPPGATSRCPVVAGRPAVRRDAGGLAARRSRQDVRRTAAGARGHMARRRGGDRPVRQRPGGCRRVAARRPAGTEPVRPAPIAGASQPAARRVPRRRARRRRARHPQLPRRRPAADGPLHLGMAGPGRLPWLRPRQRVADVRRAGDRLVRDPHVLVRADRQHVAGLVGQGQGARRGRVDGVRPRDPGRGAGGR